MEELKDVLICSDCKKQMMKVGGKAPDGKDLCRDCFEFARKTIQKHCKHAVVGTDGRTCEDCGARPVTWKTVARGIGKGLGLVCGWIARVFVMYTVPAVASTLMTLAIAYFAAKKFGLI